ncbi:hypothetical protein [Jatrophihabitans sp.]|uniref:hypothetical protein n=1 Tax=Jatrophihabitans sp. TaxID=1932789 RepID=UPI002EEADB79
MTQSPRMPQTRQSRLGARLSNLTLKKRAVLVAAMGLAMVAFSAPYAVLCWNSESTAGHLALVIAWSLLALAGVVAGLKSRRIALTESLDPASNERRIRQGVTTQRLLLPAGIAVIAIAGAIGKSWSEALLSALGVYSAPAFLLMAAGFWQRGNRDARTDQPS